MIGNVSENKQISSSESKVWYTRKTSFPLPQYYRVDESSFTQNEEDLELLAGGKRLGRFSVAPCSSLLLQLKLPIPSNAVPMQ